MKESIKSTILIIEDEPALAEMVRDELEAVKIESQICDNVPEALNRVANQKYSLLIVDMKLKKGTGDDIIFKVRNESKHLNHRTPIVVTSGHLDKDLVSSVAGKIQGAFVKPYDLEKLVQLIQSKI